MRRFELIDGGKDAPPCAVIECDQATSTFTATVEDWAGAQDVPVQFGFFVDKGQREIPPEWVWSWVEERIASPSRQNIGSVMRANGLGEYNPLELLLAGGAAFRTGFISGRSPRASAVWRVWGARFAWLGASRA